MKTAQITNSVFYFFLHVRNQNYFIWKNDKHWLKSNFHFFHCNYFSVWFASGFSYISKTVKFHRVFHLSRFFIADILKIQLLLINFGNDTFFTTCICKLAIQMQIGNPNDCSKHQNLILNVTSSRNSNIESTCQTPSSLGKKH